MQKRLPTGAPSTSDSFSRHLFCVPRGGGVPKEAATDGGGSDIPLMKSPLHISEISNQPEQCFVARSFKGSNTNHRPSQYKSAEYAMSDQAPAIPPPGVMLSSTPSQSPVSNTLRSTQSHTRRRQSETHQEAAPSSIDHSQSHYNTDALLTSQSAATSADPYSPSPRPNCLSQTCTLQPQLIKTASGMTAKILLCGDIQGSFSTFATTLSGINQRQGPFSCAVCCGNTLGNDLLGLKLDVQARLQALGVSSGCTASSSSETQLTDQDYLDGKAQFPVPVLFIDASFSTVGQALRRYAPSGVKVTDTFEYLGNFGIKRIAGLTVGFLSGRYNVNNFFIEGAEEEPEEEAIDLDFEANPPTQEGDPSKPEGLSSEDTITTPDKSLRGPHLVYYTRSVLEQFRHLATEHAGKMDLFVSCEWPLGVEECLPEQSRTELGALLELATLPHGDEEGRATHSHNNDVQALAAASSPAVSEIVELMEPRYHVAAGFGIFYSRPVFTTSNAGLASRFIGLGRPCTKGEAQPDKRLKFVHALILRPMSELSAHMLRASRFSSTSSPYFALKNPRCKDNVERVKRPRTPKQAEDSEGSKPAPFLTEDNLTKYLNSPPTPPSSDGRELTNGTTAVSRRLLSGRGSPPSGASLTAPGLTSATAEDFAVESDNKRRKAGDESVNGTAGEFASASTQGTAAVSDAPAPAEDTRAVFVSNIPYEVNMQSFSQVMASFGKIVGMHCPREPSGKAQGKAWILYETPEAARQAASASDQLKSGGRLMKIRLTTTPIPTDDGRPGEDPRPRGARAAGAGRTTMRNASVGNCQAVDVRPHTDCWFCLANPNCERRLIIAIGDKVYVALAKGGMVSQHVLIIPVTHFPNFVFCPPDVALELQRYVEALRACYRSQGMEMVVYERYFPMRSTRGMHMQLQVIPIGKEYAEKSLECFLKHGRRLGVELEVLDSHESMGSLRRRVADQINQPYFYAEIPCAEGRKIVSPNTDESKDESTYGVCRLFYNTSRDDPVSLPFNFGREAVADLTEMTQRSDWRRCVETEAVESKFTVKMQNIFSAFQPAALT